MKPEDQVAFEALYRSHSSFFEKRGIVVSFADYMAGFEAALAHRDAQPAAAVNEQLLEALKVCLSLGFGQCLEPEKINGAYALGQAEIASAKAAKGVE